jgi:hypothetical protein
MKALYVQSVLLERQRSAPACSSARVTSTGQTSLLLRDRLSNPVSRPDAAEGGTSVRHIMLCVRQWLVPCLATAIHSGDTPRRSTPFDRLGSIESMRVLIQVF